MNRILLTLTFFFVFLSVFGQKEETVEGEYFYHAQCTENEEQAKMKALDKAIISALKDKFSTIHSNVNIMDDGDLTSVSLSEVNGEWLGEIGEPQYDITYENGGLVVSVKVKGKAREIVTVPIEFDAKILRNWADDRAEDDRFRNGDNIYLSFSTPISGYLAVYLIDANKQAFCLLPYSNQQEGIYPVEANRHYLFFKQDADPLVEKNDGYIMTCEDDVEYNKIYIIFSPKEFVKAVDASMSNALPRQLDYAAFNKWLVKHRTRDERMNVVTKVLTIKKR